MSLINQVLQDLEKRNAENAPEQHQFNNVKAVPTVHKTLYVLLLAILVISGIIAFFAYHYDTARAEDSNEISPKKLEIPRGVRIIPPNNVVDENKDQIKQQPRIETRPKEILKTRVFETKAINEEEITSIQPFQAPLIDPVITPRAKKVKIKTVKVLSPYQNAQQLFVLAKKRQNLVDKQSKLIQVLELNPNHLQARLLLVTILLQQGLTDQAAIRLDQNLRLFPQNMQFLKLRSQLFLQRKNPQAALDLLQRVDNIHSQDETLLSLLAAAYQQNNQPIKSLQHYQKLLRINSNKAEYWLGLAIAQERQGHIKDAINSYNQSLSEDTLKPGIISYIKQRLKILR